MARPRFVPDDFTLGLIFAVTVASIFPCEGQVAVVFERITSFAIGLLFFCTARSCRERRYLPACVTGACI